MFVYKDCKYGNKAKIFVLMARPMKVLDKWTVQRTVIVANELDSYKYSVRSLHSGVGVTRIGRVGQVNWKTVKPN